MDKYDILETLGDGAFGSVIKAINKETKAEVAIKKMKKKFKSFDECKNLKEKKILEQLKKHDNIIKLHEMIHTNDTLMFVFEYMDFNLLTLINTKTNINENQIRGIMHQIISGLSHMHKYGYFHRDLKPENILCRENKVKICDFGLAKEIRSIPPFTDYVSTRWYRSPELLLRSTNYSSPVDIWALGCIMSEIFSKKPLFPGTSEKEMLAKITNLIGSPTNWVEGLNMAKKVDFKFNMSQNLQSKQIIAEFNKLHPGISEDAIDLMREMLRWDPNKRPTAQALLGHPFFTKQKIQPLLTPKLNHNKNDNLREFSREKKSGNSNFSELFMNNNKFNSYNIFSKKINDKDEILENKGKILIII